MTTYVVQLAGWMARAIGDSRALFAGFSGESLGLDLPLAVLDAPDVQSALSEAEAAAANVGPSGIHLETAAASEEELDIVAAFLELGVALGQFYLALDKLVIAVRANVSPATVPDATARAAAEQFADDLAKILSNAILGSALTNQAPQIAFIMRLLGLIQWRRVPRDTANPLSRDHILRTLEFHRVNDLFNDPAEHYRQSLQWGDAGFDPADIFRLYVGFFDEEVAVYQGVDAGEPFLQQGSFRITRDSTTTPPSLVLSLQAELEEKFATRSEIDKNWDASVSADMLMSGAVNGRLSPPLSLNLLPLTGSITGELRTFVDRNPGARPFDIVSGIGLFSLTADNLTAGVGLKASWDPTTGAAINPLIFVNLDKLKLKVGTEDADSFIGKLLSSAEIEGQFDLGLEWTADTGLRVKASGGIEVALPVHKQLGPVEFQTVYLALRILADGTLSLEISTALAGSLGPLSASVDRLGVVTDLRLTEGTDADFGPFDLNLRFKPPSGVGLAIDAGVVKGGGYVNFDPDKGEYSGALELTVADFLSLKAIGLISTKMPGGKPGFSLLIIITAEFNPGIQLGLGFTLIGVGGLLGLNRTVLIDALVQGVRTGSLNNILFPTNIIENAPKIISDLKAIFPPQEGIFLVGPMAKLAWGSPALLKVSLGLIIQIPGNVVILGKLRLALPTDNDKAVVVLQLSFVGALEFDKRRMWFFATLFDSRLLFITLDGEMGALVDISDDPNLILSVGGFHPRFTPPPLPFPALKRLSLSLVNESYAKMRVELYLTQTANTVQMGWRMDAYFGFSAFKVEGYFTSDTLLQLIPLYFSVEISAGFAVKIFGVGCFSVHLRGTFEGPAPWHFNGAAEISFFFWSFDVDVSVTFGIPILELLLPIAVLGRIRSELEKPESWRAKLPPSGKLYVSLRNLEGATELVLHPLGTLEISQRFAPLNLTLDRIGNLKPSDVKRVSASVQSGTLEVKGAAREKFAAAQFRDMNDAQKLSAPAFEPFDSGVRLGAAGQSWATGTVAERNVRYETIIVDTALDPVRPGRVKILDGLFAHFRRGASVSRASQSFANEKRLQPFADKIGVDEERFVVANQSDNSAHSGAASFGSYAEAAAHLAETIRDDATLGDRIHVIPQSELKVAA